MCHIDSYNPTTGEVHLKVTDSGTEEVEQVVQAAEKAFTMGETIMLHLYINNTTYVRVE